MVRACVCVRLWNVYPCLTAVGSVWIFLVDDALRSVRKK